MKKFIFSITGTLIINLTMANLSWGNSSSTYTHTPTELKPISSLSVGAYQVASVCFLGTGNCGNDVGFGKGDGYEIDTAKQCISEGYKRKLCAVPTYQSEQCPYNDEYYAKCVRDKDRACTEGGYLKECGNGQTAEATCPYDSSYQKCKCDPCEGYDYNYAQATATGYVADGSCMSCRLPKYKRKFNPCSGYTTCECGGAIGTTTCTTGTQLKYQSCKTCCENKCTLSECPENHDCDYEACSNKYCDKSCASGYSDMCTLYNTDGEQTCQNMGYRLQTCSNDAVLCPFDTTYKFCIN